MCNFIRSNGQKCKLQKALEWCHIHKPVTPDPKKSISKPAASDPKKVIELEARVNRLVDRNLELVRHNIELSVSNKDLFLAAKQMSNELKAATKYDEEVVKRYRSALATETLLLEEIDCLKGELKKTEANKPQKCSKHHKDANRTKIESLQRDVELLTKRLDEANKVIRDTNEDYQKYQIIKSYEDLHQQLQRAQVEFNKRGSLYHDLRLTRNQVAHPAN